MTRKIFVVGLWIASAAVSSSAGDRLPLPGGVFYYQPAGTVFGGEAIWTNPAGIGRYDADGFQVMADYFDGHVLKSRGFLVHRRGIGVAYRTIDGIKDSTIREWVFAVGAKLGAQVEWGGSFQWFKDGPALYDGRELWNIGILRRPGGPFSWGIVVGNLNRSKINGVRSETELRYSLGYRPLGDKLTLAADALLSTKTRFKNAEFVYHAEFTPSPGVFVSAYIDSHRNFEIGARVNLLRNFAGIKSGFSRSGKERGTTMFIGTTSVRQPSIISEPKTRLMIPLSAFGGENPVRPIFGKSPAPFSDLILALYRASEDRSVSEVVIVSDRFGYSFAQAQEVRQALKNLKQSGRKIIWFDASPGNLSYYVASVADRIVIPPVSQVNLIGLRAELTFYGGTLEKIGVKADLVRVGEYKSAAEAFTQSSASEENRRQENRLLDNLYAQLVNGIADGRHISSDSVRTLIDHGPYTCEEARTSGLVDALTYQEDLDAQLKPAMRTVGYARYVRDTITTGEWQAPATIAVVVADGEIVGRNDQGMPFSRDNTISVGLMRRAFEQARGNREVKGIVLRIDSPGGDALASDAIHHAIKKTGDETPVVVSMSGVAASGGYYIATPGTRVFASPATITGSIGIFGGKVDMSGLYQRIALGKELYTRGRFSGMLTTTRPFSDEERAKYMDQLKSFYDHFVELAAHRSSLSADSVDRLGRGQVWTGEEAKANGLVDELGGLWESLQYVQKKTGMNRYRIELYPRRRPLFVWPGRNLLSAALHLVIGGKAASDIEDLDSMPTDIRMMARLPYDLDIQ